MKLILTSTGISNPKIAHAFFSMIIKNPKEIKIAFLPTAAISVEEHENVGKARKELLLLGIMSKNIKDIDLDKNISFEDVKDCDAMYVCGGNTFHLMHKIRETGFFSIIEKFLMKDKVYVGVSAGSIVVAPAITIATVEPADSNDIGLINMSGMSLIKFEVSPHVPEVVSYKSIEDYSKTTTNKVYAFDHDSAVLVQGKNVSFVGDGKTKIYNQFT